MKCAEISELISSRVDGQLDDSTNSNFDQHVEGCSNCQEELRAYNKINALAEAALENGLKDVAIDVDFTVNVMAKVKLAASAEPERKNIFQRSFGFIIIFCVYAVYAVNTVVRQDYEGVVGFDRVLGYACLGLAALGLGFLFFTKELMSLDQGLWKSFSRKYEVFTKIDYQLGRSVGFAMVAGVLYFHVFA